MKKFMNIHKNSAVVILALLALLVPNACQKDLLDPAPLNNLSEKTIFETPDRFLSLINGIYDNLKSGQFYGGRYLVYGDIRCEEFLNETTNGVTGFSTWNHTVIDGTNEVNNLWNAAYATINACNIFLEGAPANRAVLNNEALLNQYLGEARFVRALCYHSLLRTYCRPYADGNGSKLGVPLRLRAEFGPDGNDLARASVAEVTTQILEDLNVAETNLPATNSGLTNVTRAHRNAAIALKVRVYMGMQRYADAITEANKLVPSAAPFKAASGVAHELQANVKNVFTTPYTTTESIFSMPFTENDLPGTQNGLGSYYNPGPRGIGDFSLNKGGIIGDTVNWPLADARRQFVLNHTNNKPYLNKFPAGPQHLDYAPVIRYAEVLLHLAEADARVNGLSQRAVDLLNAVRGRSDAATVFTLGGFANADALIAAIMRERRIEFLGEGHRTFDQQRLLLALPGKANVGAVNPDSKEYIWPIPSGELAANKLCVQNP
jgi:starch-binding outer membrane protein, SusD/RagB family